MENVLRWFKETSSNRSVTISSLHKNKEYPVLRAEGGDEIWVSILTVRESSVDVVRAYLPKRYTDVFTDPDIVSLNNGTLKFKLIYQGVCEKTRFPALPQMTNLVKDGISFCFAVT